MNIPMKYEDVVAKLDASLAREAALRKDLDIATRHLDRMIEAHDDAQQRLTVAEQRAAKFERLLLQTNELLYQIQGDPGAVPSSSIDAMRGEVFAALKPDAECEHSFHYFGDYPKRRCNLCNAIERDGAIYHDQ